MKIKFTILFILNSLAIVLLTYFLLYAIEHHVPKNIIALTTIIEGLTIFAILKLYLKFMGRPLKNNNPGTKERKNVKPTTHA